jgi:hypothetical protein
VAIPVGHRERADDDGQSLLRRPTGARLPFARDDAGDVVLQIERLDLHPPAGLGQADAQRGARFRRGRRPRRRRRPSQRREAEERETQTRAAPGRNLAHNFVVHPGRQRQGMVLSPSVL